jgi:hypothetical protein
MATSQDAELILKLYELRTEPTMREARKFVGNFNPATFEEFIAVQRDAGSQNNAYWRQALSYWDMAVAMVMRGAIDADLFLDCNAENIFYYAKFSPFHKQYQETIGQPFMRQTAALIEKYPAAQARYANMLKRFQTAA